MSFIMQYRSAQQVTGCWLENRGSIPSRDRKFSLRHHAHTRCGVTPICVMSRVCFALLECMSLQPISSCYGLQCVSYGSSLYKIQDTSATFFCDEIRLSVAATCSFLLFADANSHNNIRSFFVVMIMLTQTESCSLAPVM
jgi:hypothetical protein